MGKRIKSVLVLMYGFLLHSIISPEFSKIDHFWGDGVRKEGCGEDAGGGSDEGPDEG